MMTKEQKLSFIIDSLEDTDKEIADKLGLSKSMMSQIKNSSYRKLQKYHLYAFSHIYNIPSKIFDEENGINSEEDIQHYLDTYKDESTEIEPKNFEVLKSLCREWYCYSYSVEDNGEVLEYKIIIDYDYSVELLHKEKVIKRGKIEINELQSIIILENKSIPFNIIFDNAQIEYSIFNVTILTKKAFFNRELVQFSLFSKNPLPLNIAKHLLGDREKIQLSVEEKFKERIFRNLDFYNNKLLSILTPYDSQSILNSIVGKWHFNTCKIYKKHYFKIDKNLNVQWFINDTFQEEGKVTINSRQSIIEFTDELKNNSYFIFDNIDLGIDDNKIKICSFNSQTAYDHKDIMGIGILSKDEISQDIIDEVLISKEQSRLNTFVFRDRLIEVLSRDRIMD